jgi:hypothetical protein
MRVALLPATSLARAAKIIRRQLRELRRLLPATRRSQNCNSTRLEKTTRPNSIPPDRSRTVPSRLRPQLGCWLRSQRRFRAGRQQVGTRNQPAATSYRTSLAIPWLCQFL